MNDTCGRHRCTFMVCIDQKSDESLRLFADIRRNPCKARTFFMAAALQVKNQKPLRDLLENNKLDDEIPVNNPE